MALQVWLPLNGDLRNLGLSDLKFSILGSYTTVDNGGKIGKCYKNSTYGYGGIISNKTITLPVTLSWFCWINFSSLGNSSSLNGVVSNHMPTNTPANMGITIKYLTSTTGKLSCSTGNGTNRTYNTYTGNTTLSAGVWYHIGFTYNGSKIKFYVNGVLDGETSYTNQSQIAAKIGIFAWNMSSSSPYGYAVPGKLNDVRIYDHCLSEDEIHELSLGKVGHWCLNDYEILRSKCSNVTWNQLYYNGYFNSNSGFTNYSYNVETDTLTFTNSQLNIWTVFCRRIDNTCTIGNKYLIRCYVKSSIDQTTERFYVTKVNSGSTNSIQSKILVKDVWTKFAVIHTNETGLGYGFETKPINNIGTYNVRNYQVFDLTQMFGAGNEPTVEEFETMFPLHYYPYDAGTTKDLRLTIPDISGNHHNLTVNGNPTLSNDSVRYNKSTLFNGSNYLSCTSPTAEAKTLSLWAYIGSIPTSSSVLFADYKSKLSLGFYNSGTLLITRCGVTSATLGTISSLVKTNSWNHFCVVNGATNQLYINGEAAAMSGSNNWTHSSDTLMIGMRSAGTGFANKISDVRLYATALSANDVLKLYKLGN